MQRLLGVFLVVVATTFANEGAVYDEDGYLIHNPPGQAMSPSSSPFSMSSLNYPNPAPNKLRQHWWWASVSYDENYKSVVKLICQDFRLPQGLKCEESSLKLEDGDDETVYCSGQDGPFTFISKSENLRVILSVGPQGHAYLKCTSQAIYIDSNRIEVTTPRPTRPAYLTRESEEIDSEEHGGPEGDKTTTCPCGWANKVTSRIVNGTVTAPNEFPFAAALVDKRSHWQFCGAAIITTWHALTAAHCTIGWREKDPMALRIGVHNLEDDINKGPSKMIDISTIVEHQGYAPQKFVDDISLLVLREQITFSAQVGPACLPSHQYDLTNQYIKIIGWGAMWWRGPGSDELRKVDVRVVDWNECGRVYSQVKREEQTHLCTYATKKASCQGDSGGPVVWVDPETNRYTLVGLVSFGRVCADLSPSVHTDVAAYLDWVQHFVQASNPSAQICYKQE